MEARAGQADLAHADRPALSLWRIWNMCFGLFGIQIVWGLQNASSSRIFQTLGADINELAVLWIAAPATGLIVQPIIGHMSDKTWGRLGRRRPYLFYGAIITTLALFAMPNAEVLWIAAIMMWVMDAATNVTMQPFRAFIGDLLPERQQHTGFAMQSFIIGVGAVLASALPWLLTQFGVSNHAPPGEVPESVRWSFYVGGAWVFASVMWTVFTTREYSPDQMAAIAAAAPRPREIDITPPTPAGMMRGGLIWIGLALVLSVAIWGLRWKPEIYVFALMLGGFGWALYAAGARKKTGRAMTGLNEIVDDIVHMPGVMKQIALVQFFSFFGLFAMWIYTTPAVAAHHYNAPTAASPGFNEAADWVGVLFAIYNGVGALVAFFLPLLGRYFGRALTHAACLVCGAAGLFGFLLVDDPALLWIPIIGVGVAWASILATPYAILSSVLPPQKMGVYMGVMNLFIVIPQLAAATLLGSFIDALPGGDPLLALAAAGICLLAAAGACFAVRDPAARHA